MAKKVPKNIDCIYVIAFVLFVVSSYAKGMAAKTLWKIVVFEKLQ